MHVAQPNLQPISFADLVKIAGESTLYPIGVRAGKRGGTVVVNSGRTLVKTAAAICRQKQPIYLSRVSTSH